MEVYTLVPEKRLPITSKANWAVWFSFKEGISRASRGTRLTQDSISSMLLLNARDMNYKISLIYFWSALRGEFYTAFCTIRPSMRKPEIAN